jgi:hypothetical protein
MMSPMTNFAGFGAWGMLMLKISKMTGGLKSWRLESWQAGRLGCWQPKMSVNPQKPVVSASYHHHFLTSGFPAFQPLKQLFFKRFGLIDQHNRDIIPNLVH